MKAQLVLALCLLAIVACTVIAEEAEVQAHGHTHTRKVKEPDYYGDYKDPRPYPHKHLDCDNPKTWPSAWKAFPCIDADSGRFNLTCPGGNSSTVFCLMAGTGFCQFDYRTGPCRPSGGNCDIAESCTGPNATLPYNGTVARPGINVSPLCPNDALVPNNTNCTPDPVKSYGKYPMPTSGPCIITIAQPKCDGVSKKCIGSRPAGIGTPCDGDGGLYSEAYTEDGKLATVASVSSEHAEKHGWEKCKRCYNGKCRTFKWEWWKTVKEHHHKRDHGPSREYYSYDDQPYKPYGEEPKDDYPNYYDDDGDYYKKGHKSHSKRHYEDKDDEPEYEEEYAKIEVYPTKLEVADYNDDGYEPEFYCTK